MKKSWIVLAIIVVVAILAITRPPVPEKEHEGEEAGVQTSADAHGPSGEKKSATKQTGAKNEASEKSAPAAPIADPSKSVKKSVRAVAPAKPGDKRAPPNSIHYVIDEGLAVIQGDLVVGVPVDDNGATAGYVALPTIQLWNTREIPVFVQGNLPHPERVRQALELFADTPVRFVPYTDQEDALVFEAGTGVCKSYVGRVGGRQPIWVGPGCEATEIAHEIMHALGFVHEQNRFDRDQYVEVYNENIEEPFLPNFEKLPESMTKVSQQSEFDFESVMMYPTSMFAKGGKQTMRSKTSAQILPSTTLSAKDKERLQKVYGNL